VADISMLVFAGLGIAAATAAVCWHLYESRARRREAASLAAVHRRIAARRREAGDLVAAHLERLKPDHADAKALRRARRILETVQMDAPDVARFEQLLVTTLRSMARSHSDAGSAAVGRLADDLERHWQERQSGFSSL